MPPGRFFRSFGQTRLGHYVCSFFGKTEQKMSFHEWFSTLLRLGLWQNSYVRYSLWLLFQLLSLVSSVTWCHQNLQESSFLLSCFFFIITLGSSWSFIDSIWRTHPEMFVIPPKKEDTFFEKLSRIFSPIPVKKTFFEWFHTEAPAGYQANSTEWILISYFIVSIMVVLVMLVMWLLVIPLLLWFWEKCQRRLLQHSSPLWMVSTGIEILHFLPAAWTLISVVFTWFCPFPPKTEPTVLEWVFSFFRIPLKEKCTLSLKCCYARSFWESTSHWIHSTWRFIQIWCLSLLKKAAINIYWKCTLSLKCGYARTFLESTSYWIHSTWSFIQIWCFSLLKKAAINIYWRYALSLKCCFAITFLESTLYWIHSTRSFIQIWCLSLLKKVINIEWENFQPTLGNLLVLLLKLHELTTYLIVHGILYKLTYMLVKFIGMLFLL